jgi:hypothetical protein
VVLKCLSVGTATMNRSGRWSQQRAFVWKLPTGILASRQHLVSILRHPLSRDMLLLLR